MCISLRIFQIVLEHTCFQEDKWAAGSGSLNTISSPEALSCVEELIFKHLLKGWQRKKQMIMSKQTSSKLLLTVFYFDKNYTIVNNDKKYRYRHFTFFFNFIFYYIACWSHNICKYMVTKPTLKPPL